MPILLTTPYQPGDADKKATNGYPMCQLTALYHNPLSMAVTLEYQFGTATGDHYEMWTRGEGSPTKTLDVSGADVVALWSQMPKDGECVGQAIRRLTYQWLIDKKLAVGTIADAPPLTQAQLAETTTAAPEDGSTPAEVSPPESA